MLVIGIDKAEVVGGYGEGEARLGMFQSFALFSGKGKEAGDLAKGGDPMGDLPVPVVPHLCRRVRKIGFSELGGLAPTGRARTGSGPFGVTCWGDSL